MSEERRTRMPGLKKEDRVDSGKLEKDFDKRIGTASASALTDTPTKGGPSAERGSSKFAPDPLLVEDNQSEDTWLVVSPRPSERSTLDISPPRERKSSQLGKGSDVRPQSASGRSSDAVSTASRRPSKIPRVANLSSNKPSRLTSPGSESSSGSSVAAKKKEAKPALAFGRKIASDVPSAGKKESGGLTARSKNSPGSTKTTTNRSEVDSDSLQAATKSSAAKRKAPVEEISKHWQTPVRLMKNKPEASKADVAKALPSQPSGKAAAQSRKSSSTPEPVKRSVADTSQAKGKTQTAPQKLLSAVSGSEHEITDEPVDTKRPSLSPEPGPAASVPALSPGQEVPVWKLPALTDKSAPSEAASKSLLPVTPANKELGLETEAVDPKSGSDELESHPLSDTESFTTGPVSRPPSASSLPDHQDVSPSRHEQHPGPEPGSAVDSIAVDMDGQNLPPAWPSPGVTPPVPASPSKEEAAAISEETKVDPQTAAPEAPAPVKAAFETGGSSQDPKETSKPTTADSTDLPGTGGLKEAKSLSVHKSTTEKEMPVSPFETDKRMVDLKPISLATKSDKEEAPRAGIGSKSTKELSKDDPKAKAKAKQGCCGCSVM